jgi:hypothetical protein
MANTLFGLGLKVIPTRKVNTSPEEQDTTLLQFERDFSLKVFFVGDTNDSSTSNTLRIKSNWQPPPPPRVIETRVHRFNKAISSSFVTQPPIPNLTTLQESILNRI